MNGSPFTKRCREVAVAALFATVPAAGASGQDVSVDDLLDDLLEEGLFDEEPLGEDAGDIGAPARTRSILREWKGFLEVKYRTYFNDRDRGLSNEQLLVEAELELDFRFGPGLSGYFRPRLFLDAFDGDLQRFEPYEGYATYEGGGWDLRAGHSASWSRKPSVLTSSYSSPTKPSPDASRT